MKYKTYDELIKLVAKFRTEHRNLTDDNLQKGDRSTLAKGDTLLIVFEQAYLIEANEELSYGA